MHRIYTTGNVVIPSREPDSTNTVSFIAAEDGKYELDRGKLYRRAIIPDNTEFSASIAGSRFVQSCTRWTKRKEVGRLPPIHAPVCGCRKIWKINQRLRIIEERLGQTTRGYIESSYDVDDPGFAHLVKDYVQSSDK